jgi:ATP phosphoribosyltransferase regulatory subunit
MFGTAEVLEEAKAMTDNKGALSAIARLEKLYETLKLYGMEKYVSFDLGMLSKYKYYTGVILKAYTYGLGEPVCTGGRYDKLLSSFGKDAAAIGFVINIDQLMWTLSRQNIMIDTSEDNVFVVYSPDCYSDAVDISLRLRKEGVVAGLYNTCDDIFQYAKEMEVKGVVYVRQEGLTFKNCATSEELSLSKEELIKVVTGR